MYFAIKLRFKEVINVKNQHQNYTIRCFIIYKQKERELKLVS